MKHFLDIKWLCLLTFNVLAFVCVCIQHQSPLNDQTLKAFDRRLNTIQTQLNQSPEKPDLSPITQNLKQLGEFIQQLQNKDDHQLGELFTTEQSSIKKQLNGILNLLHHLDEQKHPIKMLPANQLPFTVLSIDSIQETAVASVSYHFKTQALEKGDALAGWTVLRINFAKQIIEFQNADKAHVVVHLQEANHD